jgi:hypothetical protein
MQELILKPKEGIILQLGERIEAVDEPLWIRFGLIDFAVEEGSAQHQLLNCIAHAMKHAVPTGWKIEAVRHHRHLAELIDDAHVLIIPHAFTRKRTAKRRQYAEHQIDIIVCGKLDTDSTVARVDRWMEMFLDGGGPLDCATCMNAETLDVASAGYSVEALIQTPSIFFGGLRLTLWEFV